MQWRTILLTTKWSKFLMLRSVTKRKRKSLYKTKISIAKQLNTYQPITMAKNSDMCCICLEYFDDQTWFLLCGHIFNIKCITNRRTGYVVLSRFPLCSKSIPHKTNPNRLVMDLDTLETKKLDSLSLSNKLLDRQSQKLNIKKKSWKRFIVKNCDIYVLKTLMNQCEEKKRSC